MMVSGFSDAVKQAVASLVQCVLSLLARDGTDLLPQRGAVLVVAPHPDDETLGCGATIARLRARGVRVVVVVVTDGAHSTGSTRLTPQALADMRRAELVNAVGRLGVPPEDVRLLAYPDGGTEGQASRIADDLASLAREVAPALCLAPLHLDKHPDHRAVAESVALMRMRGAISCPVYRYPIWIWTPRLMLRTVQEAIAVGAIKIPTDGFLETKRDALREHRSQFENVTGEKGWQALSQEFAQRYMKAHEVFFKAQR